MIKSDQRIDDLPGNQNFSAFQLKELKQRIVYLENFPSNVEEKNIKKAFRENGEIEKIWLRVMPEKDSQKKQAYLLFKNKEDALNVATLIMKHKIDGSDLEAKSNKVRKNLATEGDKSQDISLNDYETTIFIRNVHPRLSEDELKTHFQECGHVVSINLVKDKTNQLNQGIAYVRFASKDEMNNAIKLKNKTKLKERHLKVMRAMDLHKSSPEEILKRREEKLQKKIDQQELRNERTHLKDEQAEFFIQARKNLKGNGHLDNLDMGNNISARGKKEKKRVLEQMIESRDKKTSKHQKHKNQIFKPVPTLNEAHRKKRKLRKAQNMKKFTKIRIKKAPV
eukprot:403371683